MKQLMINGTIKEFDDNATLLGILTALSIETKTMAAAINGEIVKKEMWETCCPSDGDKIEFLHFVGGG